MKPIAKVPSRFDPALRFVKVVQERADGLVEFEFAVGEPELFVEMVLPRPAFEDFCRQQGVVPVTARPQEPHAEADEWDWSLHKARGARFRSGQ